MIRTMKIILLYYPFLTLGNFDDEDYYIKKN